jgi:tetratricopeptide (TPR) repeat protein
VIPALERLRQLLPGRHPRLLVGALALLLAAVGTGGIFLWADYHFRAAQKALEGYAFEDAEHHLGRYLAVHSGNAAGHLLAAQAARRRDAYDVAEHHLAACLRLGDMTEAAALERLLLTAQQGDLGDLEGLLKARTGPDDPAAGLVLEALTKGYLNRFWTADALVCLNRLLEQEPRHPQALLLRAGIWESRALKGEAERDEDAFRDYADALKLQPSFAAGLGLAGSLYRLGRPWEALEAYQEHCRKQAEDPAGLLGLARCRYSLHEVDEARRLLDELLERQPNHAAALLERGRLALHAGELTAAEEWLWRAAALAPPGDFEAPRALAGCLEAVHKEEEARRCQEYLRQRELEALHTDRQILQADRDPRNVDLRYKIALDLMRLGREPDGVAALFLVLEQEPQHGPAHAALAEYFERTGQPDRAARHRRAGAQRADANPGVR